MYCRELAYVGGTRHREQFRLHVGKDDFRNFDALVAGAERRRTNDLAADFTDVMKIHTVRSAKAVDLPDGAALEFAREVAIIGPAWRDPGRLSAEKAGMVRFEWSRDVSDQDCEHRFEMMTRPASASAVKEVLLERFQELDPNGFAAWDKGGRLPVAPPRQSIQTESRRRGGAGHGE